MKRLPLACISLLLFVLAGCDRATGPLDTEDVLRVATGENVQVMESAILVGGRPAIDLGRGDSSLFVSRFTEYQYGGWLDVEQDILKVEDWYIDLQYAFDEVARGDTLVHTYLDYGTATIEGHEMMKVTGLPDVRGWEPPAPYPLFENLVLYRALLGSRTTTLDGNTIAFPEAPYRDAFLAGEPVTLQTSGTDAITPATATFSVKPYSTLVGMQSGDALDFERERPVIRAGEDLVLEFDRPLRPEETFIALIPLFGVGQPYSPEVRRQATARVQLLEPTDQVRLPSDVLQEIKSHTEGAFEYTLTIFEVAHDPDVTVDVQDRQTGARYAVPFVQRNHTRVFCKLTD